MAPWRTPEMSAFPLTSRIQLEIANSLWLYIVPWGMRKVMNYVKERYNSPPVYITENGMDDSNNPLIPKEEALKDSEDKVPPRLPHQPSRFHKGGWVRRPWLLRVISAGQLGMDRRIHLEVRSLLCELREQP